MATKYLLACECGESLPVETAQAGQRVTCQCGRHLDVPTMRAIRQLPLCEETVVVKSRRSWSPAKGAVFALGILIMVWGLLFSGYAELRVSRLYFRAPTEDEIRQVVDDVDLWTTDQMWAFWTQSRDIGIPPGISAYVVMSRDVARLRRLTMIGLSIALAGMLLSLSPLLVRRTQPKKD
jgi:hypothetical protein